MLPAVHDGHAVHAVQLHTQHTAPAVHATLCLHTALHASTHVCKLLDQCQSGHGA